MLYWAGEKVITENELNSAIEIANMFGNGQIERMDVNAEIAKAIMSGNQTKAVTIYARNEGINRSEAREQLVHCGEEICKEYMLRKV